MMALLMQSVPSFEETWIKCLGDFARHRMAIQESDRKDREIWSRVARMGCTRAKQRGHQVFCIKSFIAKNSEYIFVKSESSYSSFKEYMTTSRRKIDFELLAHRFVCGVYTVPDAHCGLREMTASETFRINCNHPRMQLHRQEPDAWSESDSLISDTDTWTESKPDKELRGTWTELSSSQTGPTSLAAAFGYWQPTASTPGPTRLPRHLALFVIGLGHSILCGLAVLVRGPLCIWQQLPVKPCRVAPQDRPRLFYSFDIGFSFSYHQGLWLHKLQLTTTIMDRSPHYSWMLLPPSVSWRS